MSFDGKLFARVGSKGQLAFVRFNDGIVLGLRYGFTIVWSCGGDRLPTGETGAVNKDDILDMIKEGLLYEVSELTDPCPEASA